MKLTEIKSMLPSQHRPLQVLQVFSAGRPCGWLGHSEQGYWFHYSSNTQNQAWICLLMPPSSNFFLARSLFPVFAQHLPGQVVQEQVQQLYPDVQLGALDFLYLFNTTHLGPVSYANPDNPVVTRNHFINLATSTQKTEGNCSIDALPLSMGASSNANGCLIRTTAREGPSDTLLFHSSVQANITALLAAKKIADPLNRLPALRWTFNTTLSTRYCWFPRPDRAPNDPNIMGMEKITSLLGLSEGEYEQLLAREERFIRVLEEAIRTFCQQSTAEILLFRQVISLLTSQEVQAFVVYQQAKPLAALQRPSIVGLEYLPHC